MWRSVYLRSRLYISGTGDLEWSLHSNGEHLEVREPEDGDKIWLKMEDGVGIHLNPDGTQVLSILTGQITPYKSIVPSSDNALDLGSSSYRWRHGYFAGNLRITSGLSNGYLYFDCSNDAFIWHEETGDAWMFFECKAPSGYNATIGMFRTSQDGTPKFRVMKGDGTTAIGIEIRPREELIQFGNDVNLYRSAADVLKTDDNFDALALRIGGTEVITSGKVLKNIASVAQSLLPDADNTRDLGSSSYFWRDLYLGGSLRGLGNVQILIQSRQTYGTAIRIQGGSSTIIAGGEGGDQVWNNIANLDDEWLYLASDQSVKIITALQGGWSARIENATFSADGNNYLRNTLPSSDNTYDLGSSSYRWKNGYFVNIHTGDLVLKNGFKISETEDSVVIYSPSGQKIFEIDLDGNVLVFGEIKYVSKRM